MCKYFYCNNMCPYKKCSLKKSKNHNYIHKKKNNGPITLYSKNNSNDTLLVFEAPGIDEWAKGEPVCSNRNGSTAKKFNTELAKNNKKKDDYDIIEAVRCFPGTSTKTKNQKQQHELEKAADCCLYYIEYVLTNKHYNKIVCFGIIAASSIDKVMNNFKKKKNRYYTSSFVKNNIIILTHPMKSKTLNTDIKEYL